MFCLDCRAKRSAALARVAEGTAEAIRGFARLVRSRLDASLHDVLGVLCGALVEIDDLVYTLASGIGELCALLSGVVDVCLQSVSGLVRLSVVLVLSGVLIECHRNFLP
ncbi:hypothetical protein ACU4GR_01330 [Methylobacterium oryzae CBMB20]